jgi:hypothetical protein
VADVLIDNPETKRSSHKAEVVSIDLQKLESSDNLSTTQIGSTDYHCVCRTEDWVGKDRGCWLAPDTLADTTRPEFSFLMKDAKYDEDSNKGGTFARIKARRFLGYQSYGLLVPTDKPIGYDAWDDLGLKRYEPGVVPQKEANGKFPSMGGNEIASGPQVVCPKYDLDNFLSCGREVFEEGEPVFISVKLNGENSRYCYENGEFHCSSHFNWKREYSSRPDGEVIISNIRKYLAEKGLEEALIQARVDEVTKKLEKWEPKQNHFWTLLREDEALQKFLMDNPGVVVYGERYGHVKNYRYSLNEGQVKFAAFDIYKDGQYLGPVEARELGKELNWVPTLYSNFHFNFDKVIELATNLKPVWNKLEEGIVLSPLQERYHRKIGRVKMKVINPAYYN